MAVGVSPAASPAYREALAFLFTRTGSGRTHYGLERVRALLAAMGDPHEAVPAFHVAGTNGKGSTVATLDALLRGGGHRVARYTSPHLVDFRERIVVDGRAIEEEAVVAFVERWTPLAERMGATFFEVTTALAFDHFARAGAEVAVIETGLGGRLDSTNVLARPLAAGVTAIGFDHTELLGDTLEAIAREKGGIFKAGAPAVVGERDPAVRAVLAQCADHAGARPVRLVADEARVGEIHVSTDGTAFTLAAPLGTGGAASTRLATPLIGAFQADNVATALTMLDAAGAEWTPRPAAVPAALATVRLPGRFQRVGRRIFDVAHNPDGARVLAATLAGLRPVRPMSALVAVLADKDWRGIVQALGPVVDHFVFATAPSAPPNRAWRPAEACAHAAAHGWSAEIEPDFDRALARADAAGATVVVTGSFHTVGDAMLRLQVDPLGA